MVSALQPTIRKACADSGAELREFNSKAGDVYLLARYPPKVAVPALANSPNGIPARRVRAEFTARPLSIR